MALQFLDVVRPELYLASGCTGMIVGGPDYASLGQGWRVFG